MSYLHSVRLHFAGRFVASPSTVNNSLQNYAKPIIGPEDGSWNPEGDHRFTLDCRVTAAHAGGTPVVEPDSVLGAAVVNSGTFSPKLVDLDPEQQLVSMIFGMNVTITSAGGQRLLRGVFAAASFTDIWTRGTSGGGDERAAAMYQSILEQVEWDDLAGSPFLQALRAESPGSLSIKFNLDGYSMGQGPNFTRGRLVGSIGPDSPGSPRHFVPGRQLSQIVNVSPGGFLQPRDGINFCVALLDEAARKIRLDLGNALMTNPSGGPMLKRGQLFLAVLPAAPSAPKILGEIDYARADDWYPRTAGIVEVPTQPLGDEDLALVRDRPLALIFRPDVGGDVIANRESDGGAHVRADQFVFRLNPGDTARVDFCATQFGRPLAGARIRIRHDAGSGQPRSALTFPASAMCDAAGRGSITLQAANPGNPREFIDGQLYAITYALETAAGSNPSDFLSVLVWDALAPENPLTWHGTVERIFKQYSKLYPMMQQIVDLGDYDEVSANRNRLVTVLRLAETNSRYMPVTRDMSAAKREAIIRWLTTPGPDGKPLKGTAPPHTLAAAPVERQRRLAPQDDPIGGKTRAAAARALRIQRETDS